MKTCPGHISPRNHLRSLWFFVQTVCLCQSVDQ